MAKNLSVLSNTVETNYANALFNGVIGAASNGLRYGRKILGSAVDGVQLNGAKVSKR